MKTYKLYYETGNWILLPHNAIVRPGDQHTAKANGISGERLINGQVGGCIEGWVGERVSSVPGCYFFRRVTEVQNG